MNRYGKKASNGNKRGVGMEGLQRKDRLYCVHQMAEQDKAAGDGGAETQGRSQHTSHQIVRRHKAVNLDDLIYVTIIPILAARRWRGRHP